MSACSAEAYIHNNISYRFSSNEITTISTEDIMRNTLTAMRAYTSTQSGTSDIFAEVHEMLICLLYKEVLYLDEFDE